MSPETSTVARHRVYGVLASLVTAVVLFAVPTTAEADGEVVAVGWWTRLPTASAPDGGINVGSAPDGPNSVAAVRVDAGNGLTSLTVTATEAGGVPEAATVHACLASDVWAPAEGGALEEAPEIDCTNGVPFERGDDGVWTADATSLVSGATGTASIGFVAVGPSSDNPLGAAPSEVQYERPVAFGTSVPTTPSTTDTAPPTASAAPPTRATASPPTPTTQPVTTTTPQEGALVTTTTAFDERSTGTDDASGEATDEQALRQVSAVVDGGEGRPIREAFFLLFLALLVGVTVGGISKVAELRS